MIPFSKFRLSFVGFECVTGQERGVRPIWSVFGRGIMTTGNHKGPLRPAMAVLSTGIEMAVAITVGYFIGNWLDGRFGTGPWLMYVFLAIGTAAAFRGLWRTARRYWSGDDQDSEAGSGDFRGSK